jgi:hypothetical protein
MPASLLQQSYCPHLAGNFMQANLIIFLIRWSFLVV